MPNLIAVDWLILLLYFFFVLAIGFSLRQKMKTSRDFLLAGRAQPAWLCGLAFLGASLGSLGAIVLGAAGAQYGLASVRFFLAGAIPAMLFTGLFMMPLYYGSQARSVPEFLGLRFDRKTRVLNACLFLVMTVVSAGIAMAVMARVFQALHVFDELFYAFGWPWQGTFTFSLALAAVLVLAYVLLGGLTGVLRNQVLQFFVLVAGFLPMVLLGLKSIGGWNGLKASPFLNGFAAPTGGPSLNLAVLGFGVLLGAGYWCADFRVLQTAFAAKNAESARRVPLIAAAACVFLPFLLILPGVIAIGLPTPHTTTVVTDENGVIYHSITVVPRAAEAGQGLVPARIDPATGNPAQGADGRALLDYGMAAPNMLGRFLPTGFLGLGLAALLACLMSGVAAGVAAFNTVFTYDLYESSIPKKASDSHSLAVGRWAAVGCVLLSVVTAYAAVGFKNSNSASVSIGGVVAALLLLFSVVNLPQLAAVLLGMFSRRATGHGAFAGLIAGAAAALLHHGLTLPAAAHPGLCGGWIAVLHRYPGGMAQGFATAALAFGASLLVAAAVSFCTEPRPAAELAGLVRSLTPQPKRAKVWWKRPEALAATILLVALAVSLFFA